MANDNIPTPKDIPSPQPLTEERGLQPATKPPAMPKVQPPKQEKGS